MTKKEIYNLPISAILEDINRDRSAEWSVYDLNTTLLELIEGIDLFMAEALEPKAHGTGE